MIYGFNFILYYFRLLLFHAYLFLHSRQFQNNNHRKKFLNTKTGRESNCTTRKGVDGHNKEHISVVLNIFNLWVYVPISRKCCDDMMNHLAL